MDKQDHGFMYGVAVNQNGDGEREVVWGYQAGGGVELRLAGRVSLVGEYVFTSLDNRESSTIRLQGPAPATNAFILADLRAPSCSGRAGSRCSPRG